MAISQLYTVLNPLCCPDQGSPKIARLSKKPYSGRPYFSICRQSLDTELSSYRVMVICPHGDRAWHIQPIAPTPRIQSSKRHTQESRTSLRIKISNTIARRSVRIMGWAPRDLAFAPSFSPKTRIHYIFFLSTEERCKPMRIYY